MITDLNRRNFLTARQCRQRRMDFRALARNRCRREHAHQAAKSPRPRNSNSSRRASRRNRRHHRAHYSSDETPALAKPASFISSTERSRLSPATTETYREVSQLASSPARNISHRRKFSSVTPEQQDKILHSFNDQLLRP